MLISQHQFLNLVPRARSQGILLLVSRSEGRVGEVPGNEFVFGSFVTETFWVGHIRSYTLDENFLLHRVISVRYPNNTLFTFLEVKLHKAANLSSCECEDF